MTEIVDLQEWRNAKVKPASDCVRYDESTGQPIYKFGCDFKHTDGGNYAFHLWAYSLEDAEEKLKSIKESAAIYGQVYAEIPA